MPIMTVENRAIRAVQRHLKKEKWQVEDVTRGGQEHKGYDLKATRGKTTRKIEVKGCSTLWGIPDFFNTEWDERKKRIVADYLYVVFLRSGKRTVHCEIPRKAISSKDVKSRIIYRFRGSFTTKNSRERYLKKTSN